MISLNKEPIRQYSLRSFNDQSNRENIVAQKSSKSMKMNGTSPRSPRSPLFDDPNNQKRKFFIDCGRVLAGE